jgi:hypothetical protein
VAGWLRSHLRPGPLTGTERADIEESVRRCYAVAGLAPPERIIWARSPTAGRNAANRAARLLVPPPRQLVRRATAVGELLRRVLLAAGLVLYVAFIGALAATALFGAVLAVFWSSAAIYIPPFGAAIGAVGALFWCRAQMWEQWTVNAAVVARLQETRRAAELIDGTTRRIHHACVRPVRRGARPYGRKLVLEVDRAVRVPVQSVMNAVLTDRGPETVAGDAWWLEHGGLSVDVTQREAFEAWHGASRVSWWAHPRFAVISEPPVRLDLETLPGGRYRLHRDDGPALQWQGEPGVGFWHGVRVPVDLITPGWTVPRIHATRNAEVQRAAIERMGWLEYLDQAGLELIATALDPGNPPHRLSLYGDNSGRLRNARILVMTNGSPDRTGAEMRYAEPVPAVFNDPVAAAAWQYDIPADTYRNLARRT